MKNIFDFTGKTILVTGASSGIGRQTAITLSEYGAKIVLVARREDKLKETLDMMSGDGHIYKVFDLCELDNIDDLVSDIVSETGRLDGLAFCAGITEDRPYKVSTPDFMKKIMETNFFPFYEMVRQFVKKKNSPDGAKIVVISSNASIAPKKGQAAYAASKAAIDSSIICLAKELLPRKININSIRPSWVKTPMTAEYSQLMKEQPLGVISPEKVASLILYLLSSAADIITGTSFNIDGGLNLQNK